MVKYNLHVEDENGVTVRHEILEGTSFDQILELVSAETWTQNPQCVEFRRVE